MNKEILDIVDDDRVPDELKVKMIMMSLRMQKCKTIGEAKQVLIMLVDIFTEVEKLTDDDASRSH